MENSASESALSDFPRIEIGGRIVLLDSVIMRLFFGGFAWFSFQVVFLFYNFMYVFVEIDSVIELFFYYFYVIGENH